MTSRKFKKKEYNFEQIILSIFGFQKSHYYFLNGKSGILFLVFFWNMHIFMIIKISGLKKISKEEIREFLLKCYEY